MNPYTERRNFMRASAALAAATALPAMQAQAQDFSKPLRFIVAFPAGGVADIAVRSFAEQWHQITKQNVVVDNRPGGSFQIAMQQMVNAPADGNTWLHLSNAMSAAQASFGRYDLLKQLTPVAMAGGTPGAIFVSQDSPIKTPNDLIEAVKANPAKANYGAILGGNDHLTIVSSLRNYGANATLIPFRGGPDTMTALAQNEILFSYNALPLIIPFKGKVRVIAILTQQRAAMLPDVPTYKELGFNTPEIDFWGGFAVPAATPAAIVKGLYPYVVETMKSPSVIAKFTAQGVVPKYAPGEELARLITDELKWMTPVATELNLKAG